MLSFFELAEKLEIEDKEQKLAVTARENRPRKRVILPKSRRSKG